jgi:hypothetical protein
VLEELEEIRAKLPQEDKTERSARRARP